MKKINIFGVHGKIRILEGGFTKSQYIGGGDCLKNGGGLGSLQIEGGEAW